MNPDKSDPGGDLQHQNFDGNPGSTGVSPVQHPQNVTAQQSAAANVIRTQIDSLYGDQGVTAQVATDHNSPQAVDSNPYHRTHSAHPLPEADQWKEYHSAWQNYYQKYYENYYTAQVSATPAAIIAEKATNAGTQNSTSDESKGYFTHQPVAAVQETPEELSNDQALFELRQKLLGKVQASASKIRKSRHFMPIAAALGVILIFTFIQYNRVFISNVKAYVSPGSIDPQNIVVDPTADIVVSAESRLIIPKINVDVPVTYDVGTDNASQMKAMEGGLAHFPIAGASSHPGEIGNTVLAGHSSNDLFDVGDYKFIFAQLEKLSVGDTIYANYNSKRYTYTVTRTETVKPTEVNKLVYATDKPVLTLITCTPLGTALNRFLVTAEQVSPDPSAATAAPAGSGTAGADAAIPGNSPTVLERLFGAN